MPCWASARQRTQCLRCSLMCWYVCRVSAIGSSSCKAFIWCRPGCSAESQTRLLRLETRQVRLEWRGRTMCCRLVRTANNPSTGYSICRVAYHFSWRWSLPGTGQLRSLRDGLISTSSESGLLWQRSCSASLAKHSPALSQICFSTTLIQAGPTTNYFRSQLCSPGSSIMLPTAR